MSDEHITDAEFEIISGPIVDPAEQPPHDPPPVALPWGIVLLLLVVARLLLFTSHG